MPPGESQGLMKIPTAVSPSAMTRPFFISPYPIRRSIFPSRESHFVSETPKSNQSKNMNINSELLPVSNLLDYEPLQLLLIKVTE